MSARWAVIFKGESLQVAMPLRLRQSIECCRLNDVVFLRGPDGWEDVADQVRQIPDAIAYRVLPDESLVRIGSLIPERRLPEGPWEKLSSVFELRPGPAAMPAAVPRRVPISLVRDATEKTAGAVLTSVQEWTEYASKAPMVRLKSLRFAAAGDGRLIVIGRPLPAVRGDYLSDDNGLLVPCGYGWEPRVEAAILRRVLGLAENDAALLLPDGGYELIPADALTAAFRSASRLTLERLRTTAPGP